MNKPENKILRRIRHLLAKAHHSKAASSETLKNEAEAALKQAVALMQKYGISEGEVSVKQEEGGGVSIDPADIKDARGFEKKTRMDRWDLTIANLAARVAGCRTYVINRSTLSGFRFFGLESDVAVAIELFPWLRKSMNDAAASFLKDYFKVSAINPKLRSTIQCRSFKDGWIMGVRKAIDEAEKARQNQQVPVNSGALVVMTDDLAKARDRALALYAEKQLNLRYTTSRGPSHVDPRSFSAGHAKGSSVRVGKDNVK